MANPFTVYVAQDDTLQQMKQTTDETSKLLDFSSRNAFLNWLLTQPAEELAKALRPLRAKDYQKRANQYRQS